MPQFDHEKLKVYNLAMEFVSWSESILSEIPKASAVRGQLDRARTSIPLNLAEGNGKYTSADCCRFFDIARGSSWECDACLDVAVAQRLVAESEIEHGKDLLHQTVSMIVGLIRSNSPDRLHEEIAVYRVGED
jgi:four helix bundle protein